MSSQTGTGSQSGTTRARGGRKRGASSRTAERASPRSGAKRTITQTIRQLPAYLRLLLGLMTDNRVAVVDKALVFGAIAYILLPTDLIPDFIPFLGQVDDVFLLTTSLQRLIHQAGRRVVLSHWSGDPDELADLNLTRVLTAAAFFLPPRMRRRLKMLGR